MNQTGIARLALKRGALVTAANWQVIVIQAVGDSAFKLLVAIPLLGGALLVTFLMGQDLASLLERNSRDILAGIAEALLSRPGADGFRSPSVSSLSSVVMFLIKAGTSRCWSTPSAIFSIGSTRGRRRVVPPLSGAGLPADRIYILSVALYAVIVLGYRNIGGRAPRRVDRRRRAVAVGLVVWTTAVNLVYPTRIVAVTGGTSGAPAGGFRFLRQDARPVADLRSGPSSDPRHGPSLVKRGLLPRPLSPASRSCRCGIAWLLGNSCSSWG
jgi:hypothetical protein